MKKHISRTLLFVFICCTSHYSYSQNNTTLVDELNKVLENSLYKTSVKIDDAGVIYRKDSNGNTFVFDLDDIKEIKYLQDGFHNIMISLKKGKKSIGVVEGKKSEADLNVIAFRNKTECEKAIEILKKLISD